MQEMPDQVPVGHIPRAMTVIARGELTREVSEVAFDLMAAANACLTKYTDLQVLPGDILDLDGVFMPTPYSGFKAIRAGLIADTYLEVHRVRKMKKAHEYVHALFCCDTVPADGASACAHARRDTELTERSRHDVEELSRDANVYSKLASSIAPEIYGHEDVKKALLLQVPCVFVFAGMRGTTRSAACLCCS